MSVSLFESEQRLGRGQASRFRHIRQVPDNVMRFARRQPLGFIGAVALAAMVIVAAFASRVATHDPLALDITTKLASPSAGHWFGTDEYGRDVYSRVIYGLRVAVEVAATSVLISTLLGMTIGIAAGYIGGWVDLIALRFVDILMAFPAVILALAIVSVFGQSQPNVVMALIIVQTPTMSRVVRATTLSVKERVFIEAARSTGVSDVRILWRHVAPNTVPIVLVVASASVGNAVLAEASLSFLGLGIPAPAPSLGSMLSGSARKFGEQAPWLVIFPGLALGAFVFATNFLGDALRDVLDPRLRGRG